MLSRIEGAVAYLDDIIIVGLSKQNLFERTISVMKRIFYYGFYL